MEMESGEGEVNIGEVGVHGPQEEDDEIEYMPPKLPGTFISLCSYLFPTSFSLEQPWAPPFDMPDYKVIGRAVVSIAHGARRDDTLDAYYAADNTFTVNHLYSTSEDISLNLKPVGELLDQHLLSLIIYYNVLSLQAMMIPLMWLLDRHRYPP